MNTVLTTLTVASWVVLLATGYWTVSTARVWKRARRPADSAWMRRLGVLASVVGAAATGAFFVHPPLGVYLLAAAGVLAYAVGTLAAAGAMGTAIAATDPTDGVGRRLRTFWCAASVYYRGTRLWFGAAMVAFLLAALVAALSVDASVRAAGAVARGGVLACVVCLVAVGVFVPATRDESVAEAVAEVVDSARS